MLAPEVALEPNTGERMHNGAKGRIAKLGKFTGKMAQGSMHMDRKGRLLVDATASNRLH